jgi:hypothetical protein
MTVARITKARTFLSRIAVRVPVEPEREPVPVRP